MIDLILALLLLAIVGGAAAYLYRAKRRGVRCVGCPSGGNCAGCRGHCTHKEA